MPGEDGFDPTFFYPATQHGKIFAEHKESFRAITSS